MNSWTKQKYKKMLWPHTPKNSMNALANGFSELVLNQKLHPTYSPDLNTCKFYLQAHQKKKCYVDKPYSLWEMKNFSAENFCYSKTTLLYV
jgi:hypothetical protein